MKIVIVGAGDAGFELTKRLVIENKDVIVIEQDPDVASRVSKQLDCKVVTGSGNRMEILRQAGIDKADFFISVTGSDEVNIITCGMVYKEFDVGYTIAGVKNIDYFGTKGADKTFPGIDFIVNPEIEAARKIIEIINSGASSEIIIFEQGVNQMKNIVVSKESFMNGLAVKELWERVQANFLIAGIEKSDSFVIPTGDTVINEEDKIYFIASIDELEKIFQMMGRPPIEIKDVLIVGGSNVGIYVAEHLLNTNAKNPSAINRVLGDFTGGKRDYKIKNMKIIDSDYEKCKELSDRFPEAVVIEADISDETIIAEEGLDNFDLVIMATGNYELNILAALYLKTVGIERAISLVKHKNYMNMASKLGVDAIVSSRDSISNPILKLIRRGNIMSIHSISGGNVEIMEFHLEKNNKLTGKKIMDHSFPAHSLILSVVRDGKCIIPHGDLEILAGDHVIIIAQKDQVEKIETMVVG